MIVCTKCGFQNEDSDTFCGSCASFLEWSGERTATEDVAGPQPEAEPDPEPEPEAHAGLVERVKDRIGRGDARTTEEADPAGPVADAEPTAPIAAPVPAPAPSEAHATTAPPMAPGAAHGITAPPLAPTPPPPVEEPAGGPPSTPVGDGPARHPVPDPVARAAPSSPAQAPPSAVPAERAGGPPGSPPAPAPPAPTSPPSTPGPGAGSGVRPTPPAARVPTAWTPPPVPGQTRSPVNPTTETAATPPVGTPAVPSSGPGLATPSSGPGPTLPGSVRPRQPEAVKPTAVKARPARSPKVTEARVINPGDRVCGQCGEGNDPERRFCRKCGASLKAAEVFQLTFWQRVRRRLGGVRHRKVRAAGERPRNRRRIVGGSGPGWLTSWVTKVVVVAVIVFAILANFGPYKKTIRSHLGHWYHDVVNVVHPTYNPVHPVSARATSAAPGHPASLAIDGAANTSWQSSAAGSGAGQSLTITLAAPTDIDKIGFLIGDTDTPASYLSEPRPELIQISYVGSASTKEISFKDSPAFQSFTVSAANVATITFTLEAVYPSATGQNASIAEIELFSKSR